ncbi:MAG: gluconate 2-dehydrogenase subunit 3 family protein [Flavobacteriia bacterium]|jgi:hypothetical protein|nr:gluconate 2-dehydrogenase subunit 3 family protein [Flavobacteriia bacterium]
MDRRKALKNIGIGFGAITVTPTVVSLMQSCQTNPSGWMPAQFSKDQFQVVSQLMDLIIPTTDIPGAIDLQLPQFLDGYVGLIMNDKAQQKLKSSLDQLIAVALKDTGKSAASELNREDLDAQLAKYLRADESTMQVWKNDADSPQAVAQGFAVQLRSLTINAFKTNEYIGENVLAYVPIPGQQKGCVDLMEATGGKAYSL